MYIGFIAAIDQALAGANPFYSMSFIYYYFSFSFVRKLVEYLYGPEGGAKRQPGAV